MENFTYVCPDCNGEHIMTETVDGIYQKTCPSCGTVVKVLVRNGRCYSISAVDHERAQNMNIAELKKKDAKMMFANGFIQALTRFCELSLVSRIALCSAIIALVILSIGIYLHYRPADVKECMAFAEMDNVNTKRTHLGVDGWLQDAVIPLNGLKSDDFDSFMTELNELVYGVSYKPYYIDLSDIPQHTCYSTHNLNLQVSAEELQSWFIQEEEPLIHSETGKQTTLAERLGSKVLSCDLYYSAIPNFVVMVLPRFWDISSSFRDITYKFSLDSDLLLGAIVSDSFVAIVGREREVPVTELPPLRVETLFTLAATHEEELCQSFERDDIFAGKLPGGKDFAPIFLSDELWHTEYGSLLIVADQMIKIWSENGEIKCVGFNYPNPIDWAFDHGAFNDLNVNKLTYNWNTSGAGYEVEPAEDIPYAIYAVNRTGSLPVSYIPGDTDMVADTSSIYLAEEKGYDFFSMLNNPELVRVVQYAAFYQICHNYQINVNDERKHYHTIASSSLAKTLKHTLNRICSEGIDTEALETAFYKEFMDSCTFYSKKYDVQMDTCEVMAIAKELSIEGRKAIVQELDSIKLLIGDLLNEKVSYGSRDFLTEVSNYMVNPRSLTSFFSKNYDNLEEEYFVASYANQLLSCFKDIIQWYGKWTDCYKLEQVMKDYLKEN